MQEVRINWKQSLYNDFQGLPGFGLETWVKLIEQNFIVLTLCEDLPVFKVGLGFGLDTKFELFVKKVLKNLIAWGFAGFQGQIRSGHKIWINWKQTLL